MCPTICLGDRVVADMGAHKSESSERGDLILLKHSSFPGLFIKRVIGSPGDIVAPGPNRTILINGEQLSLPKACGSSIAQSNSNTVPTVLRNDERLIERELAIAFHCLGVPAKSTAPAMAFRRGQRSSRTGFSA